MSKKNYSTKPFEPKHKMKSIQRKEIQKSEKYRQQIDEEREEATYYESTFYCDGINGWDC